jgi:hypothetical protein
VLPDRLKQAFVLVRRPPMRVGSLASRVVEGLVAGLGDLFAVSLAGGWGAHLLSLEEFILLISSARFSALRSGLSAGRSDATPRVYRLIVKGLRNIGTRVGRLSHVLRTQYTKTIV